MDFVGHAAFVKARAEDLQKIANRTQNQCEAQELANDALLVALAIEEERGIPVNWWDSLEQDLILKELKAKHVWERHSEKKRLISMDQERADLDGNIVTLIDRFQAEETSDPMALLEHREEEEKEKARRLEEDAILESYSQSVAYNIVLWHFDNLCIRVAAYLAIGRGTLNKRITHAAASLKVQSSLFDRIERISGSFMPPPGRPYTIREERHLGGQQLGWDFASA